MKIMTLILMFILSNFAFASFTKKASVEPFLVQEDTSKYWCPVSGLKISDYYKTSYIAKLKTNNRLRQYSSIAALFIDIEDYGIDLNSIKVIDVPSQKYVNIKKAFFVINSKIKPTYLSISALGFKNKNDALEYIKNYKGEVVSFSTLLKNVKKKSKIDLIKLKKLYKKKIYPKGKRIFEKKCEQHIDISDYFEINDLKADLVNDCKTLKEKNLHYVALYLWNKKIKNESSVEGSIHVEDTEKCPVCGMFTYKYPRWAAQIYYIVEDKEHHFSFDGVKDLMKFYFNPNAWGNYKNSKKENISKILVTDYYSQKAIDGKKAFYVINSDIYGPMGHEFIPFENMHEAKIFMKDHKGDRIISFEEINLEMIKKLDE